MADDSLNPDEALAAAAAAVDQAKETAAAAEKSSELVLGRDDAAATKARLGAAYSQIATSRREALDRVQQAKAAIEEKQRELDAARRALADELEPMQKQLERLEDGIAAVNLYLGRDETIQELRVGESAPADTPVVVRQLVLAMDEETALHAEDGGLDFQDLEKFTTWLLESDEHLDQVIPDRKGVVAFMARRTPIDYNTGNPIAERELNRRNFATHWLIRNGRRLYLMETEFAVGTHLIPPRRSFTKLFEDHDGRQLEPGSRDWLLAEERADAMTRHYMKVALILQGLLERTAVFHPLPTGGLNLLSDADYDAGKVVLIEEDDRAITTGRQPFREWLRERVALLEVGHRIVGSFPASSGTSSYRETYVTPRSASAPKRGAVHTINRVDAQALYFTFERSDEVEKRDRWGNWAGYGPAERRATYRIPRDELDRASFVPIDTVTVDEMRAYLAARTERHAYAQMFPALKAAIAFKLAEEAAEAPFRALLAAELAVDDDTARDLVTWWKTANKWHRALNGDPAHEKRAAAAIIAEHRRRQTPVTAAGRAALAAVPGAMVRAVRTGDLVAVVPSQRRYGAGSVPQNLYVDVHVFTRGGRLREVKTWQTLTRAQVARWTVIDVDDRFTGWMLNPPAGRHLPDPAIDELLEQLRAFIAEQELGEVAVLKYREGDYGTKVIAYLASRLQEERGEEQALVQPYLEWYVEISTGGGNFDRESTWVQTHHWRLGRHGSGPEVPIPPHTVNYSREWPESIVEQHEQILAADLSLAGQWADLVLARRRRSSRITAIAQAVYNGWSRHEEEQRRLRFVEDFGDESLWADHKKAQKPTPFPLSQNAGSPQLRALAEAVLDAALPVDGRTVGQLLADLGHAVDGIPDELLPVTIHLPDSV